MQILQRQHPLPIFLVMAGHSLVLGKGGDNVLEKIFLTNPQGGWKGDPADTPSQTTPYHRRVATDLFP